MKRQYSKGLVVLITFFLLVLACSFYFNRNFYQLAIAGESSAGTWLSGVLLVMSATLSMVIGMRTKVFPWFCMTAFFLVLALDERFMFHEQLKERLIFAFHPATHSHLIYELPVILASCIGGLISFLLWKEFTNANRILLYFAIGLGLISVVFDVFTAGVLIEECAKLLAEVAITCALLRQVEI
ncbi:MAG: hypothetical protein JWM14_569 [Chitinophagaceae bacterium]|nr:hypothetical protein [Chitinophagaceae bacterium]